MYLFASHSAHSILILVCFIPAAVIWSRPSFLHLTQRLRMLFIPTSRLQPLNISMNPLRGRSLDPGPEGLRALHHASVQHLSNTRITPQRVYIENTHYDQRPDMTPNVSFAERLGCSGGEVRLRSVSSFIMQYCCDESFISCWVAHLSRGTGLDLPLSRCEWGSVHLWSILLLRRVDRNLIISGRRTECWEVTSTTCSARGWRK